MTDQQFTVDLLIKFIADLRINDINDGINGINHNTIKIASK